MAAEHPEAAKQLSVVAENLGSHLSEVSRDIGEHIVAEIPELRGDPSVIKILQASIAENVATLLHIFENDIPLDNVEGPAAASEYARRLAQRGIPLSAMSRAYRIGHWRFLQWCLDELNRQGTGDELSSAINRRMLQVSFGYIDRVTEHVIVVYQQERDHWLLSQTATRAARVRDLLGEQDVDLNWAEQALGYRLRQNHLGLVAWLPTLTGGGAGLARLDRITNEIARKFGCPARPLFVPRDAVLSWVWLPFGSHSDVSWKQLSDVVERSDPSVHVCAGDVGYGIEGFRSTHRQALRTQELAAVASSAPQFTDFSTVAPIALMATNVDDMRAWVWARWPSMTRAARGFGRPRRSSWTPAAVTPLPPALKFCTRTPCSTASGKPRKSSDTRSSKGTPIWKSRCAPFSISAQRSFAARRLECPTTWLSGAGWGPR
jgi:hypothetical protein